MYCWSLAWRILSITLLAYAAAAAAAAKSLKSCPTLCDPIDGSPPGSLVSGILQARTLEWVAISFSNAWKWKVKVKSLSRVWLFETPWTAAYQAPPPMGFSRQEYWSGVPLPSPLNSLHVLKIILSKLWLFLYIPSWKFVCLCVKMWFILKRECKSVAQLSTDSLQPHEL